MEKLNEKFDEWSKFTIGKRYERRTYLDIFLTFGVMLFSIPMTVFGCASILSQDYFGASYWFLAIALSVSALMLVKVFTRRKMSECGELHFTVLDIHTGPSGAMDYLVRFDNGTERNLIEYDKTKKPEKPVHPLAHESETASALTPPNNVENPAA